MKKAVFSRRRFGTVLTAAAAIRAASAQQSSSPPNPNTTQQRRGTAPEIPPFEGTLTFARSEAPAKAQPFRMTQVRITDGVYKLAQEWNRGYMSRLAADRLVRNFQLNAGLPATGEPLGGWERYTPGRAGELRGHFTGHYLSALALLYASTGDKEAKAKGDAIVADLAKCQQKLGGGYLSAFPTEWFDRLDALKPVWAPFYTYHKVMAGMLDMYQHCDNRQALEVVQGMAKWADDWTASKSEEHMQEILKNEYGGMNEVLYNLATVTGDDRWAAAGDRFTKKTFFNPLALRRDELRGLHVNTHIPQVIGAARRYELSSDMRFHDVADFFWYEVTSARAYVTGGTSNGEGWLVQPRRLAAELERSTATAECCCAYNMLKLTRRLYSWTADPRYFDYYERVLLNHRIGTVHPQNGHTQYYLSLTPGAWKTFCTEDQSFWCCTGTGVEEYAKLNDSIYWHDNDGVYVNLFIPSELNWSEKGFRLRLEANYPEQPSATLVVSVDRPSIMPIRIRVPSWLESGGSVKVNGKTLDAAPTPGSYLTITRNWRNGDRIELTLPMRLRIEAMPDDRNMIAILYGPLVLAGDLGSDGLDEKMLEGPSGPPMQRAPKIDIPHLRRAGADPASWIKPADKPLTFRAAAQPQDVTLAPLNTIFGRRYTVYWQAG